MAARTDASEMKIFFIPLFTSMSTPEQFQRRLPYVLAPEIE